jgi:septin family protein
MKNKELDNNSDSVKDTRIHLCIYFIQGPHTKELDYNIIQKLSKYVNVLPVIAKVKK